MGGALSKGNDIYTHVAHTHIHTLIHTCLFAMTWQSDCQVCHRAEDMIVVRVFWGSCNTSHTSPGGAAAARPRSISKVEHPLQLGWRLWEMCQMTSGKWFRREKAIGIFLPPKINSSFMGTHVLLAKMSLKVLGVLMMPAQVCPAKIVQQPVGLKVSLTLPAFPPQTPQMMMMRN